MLLAPNLLICLFAKFYYLCANKIRFAENMKSKFKVGQRVWVSRLVGIVINVKTDSGELFFEKEDMFKSLEALELCTL
jgi:hypothetical protein